jgi:hypothetical protein
VEVKPEREHVWLQQLVGSWTVETECSMGPDQPPMKWGGRETTRTLGGIWVICEGEGEMPNGGIGRTIMTLGFDPTRKRFVGSFVGSMMTHLWLYDGSLDASEKILTLDAEGPDMTQTRVAKYHDIIEIVSDDHRKFSSEIQLEDGSWNRFMTGHYHRVK